MGKVKDFFDIAARTALTIGNPIYGLKNSIDIVLPGAGKSIDEGIKGLGIKAKALADGTTATKQEVENIKESLLNTLIKLGKQLIEALKAEQISAGAAVQANTVNAKSTPAPGAGNGAPAAGKAAPAAKSIAAPAAEKLKIGMDELIQKTAAPVAGVQKSVAEAAKSVSQEQGKAPVR